MNYFDNIVGNIQLKKRLAKDLSNNSFSHAYIIEGPTGSGRHLFAKSTVAAIECRSSTTKPCGECLYCKKILSEISPDIVSFGLSDKKSIGIEISREIKDTIHVAPIELSVKAYIIDSADTLTEHAQNALLLSLEEPPPFVMFFLLCENSSNLLATIRSRMPVFRTERLSTDEIEEYLLTVDRRALYLKNEAPEDYESFLFLSDGRIGKALGLLDGDARKRLFDIRAKINKMVSMLNSKSKAQYLEFISSIGLKRAEAIEQLILLQYALRDLILLKKCDAANLCFFNDRDEAVEKATHFTLSGLITLYDSTVLAIDDLERNANIRLALINMMQRADLI